MARNEITGDIISTGQAKGDKEKYDKGWDAIFGKKQKELLKEPTPFLIQGGTYYVPLYEVTDLSAFGCQEETRGESLCPSWCGNDGCVLSYSTVSTEQPSS